MNISVLDNRYWCKYKFRRSESSHFLCEHDSSNEFLERNTDEEGQENALSSLPSGFC